ncbi:Ig-like domain-containing protein [Gallaecimonas sp. GXIMD4217]|uniref:Ig-like domain-containing protein n=1 Tax=Gallaecimonas sp. GXIMD4217 TaxID=3131927 RepID=UPI00311B138B
MPTHKNKILAALGLSTALLGPSYAAVTPALGEERVLVMMVNFQDDPDNKPWSMDEIQKAVFQDTSDFYQDASANQLWLSGDVNDWHTVSLDSTQCDINELASQANGQALSNGYDAADYDLVIYFHPKNACGWAGQGTVGSHGRRVFMNGSKGLGTLGHEIGHTFGLRHAHGLDCGDQVTEGNCRSFEYGDLYDIMGTGVAYLSVFNQELLGWQPDVQVATNGLYELSPFTSDTGPVALKVPAGVDEQSGAQRWLYLEYRQADGYDAWMVERTTATSGILVRSVVEGDANSSMLLDMTPGSDLIRDFNDAALVTGQYYVDPQSGASISVESVSATGATVYVNASEPQCVSMQPSLALEPAVSDALNAGASYTYQVTVANNDDTQCQARSFALSSELPAGWSGSFAATNMTLAPGESTTASFSVTSDRQAGAGDYELLIEVTSDGKSTTAPATFVVVAENSVPMALNDEAATGFEQPVTIAVLANDKDPDGDPLAVTAVSGVNGSARINNDGTITFTPALGFSGSEVFNYSISDGRGGSASALVTVTVAEPANQAPRAANDEASTGHGQAVTIPVLANDSDPDGDSLTVTGVTGVNGAAVINEDGSITFTPASGFSGTETFSYQVADGRGGHATAGVAVSVAAPINNAPIAMDDQASTDGKSTLVIPVLVNDYDPEGDKLLISGYTQGSKGTVSLGSNGTLVYNPGRKFRGSDSFSYQITDGELKATATVTVSLQADGGGGKGGKGRNK